MSESDHFRYARKNCACVICTTKRNILEHGLDPEDEAGHAIMESGVCVEEAPLDHVAEDKFTEEGAEEGQLKFHNLDGTAIFCVGKDTCALCLVLEVAPTMRQPPSWDWYVTFLLEYATKEALACRQKLVEYGFSLDDVFAAIHDLAHDNRATWWNTWLKQGYFRHGEASRRIINQEKRWEGDQKIIAENRKYLHKRVADMYGYSSLAMAKLRLER